MGYNINHLVVAHLLNIHRAAYKLENQKPEILISPLLHTKKPF